MENVSLIFSVGVGQGCTVEHSGHFCGGEAVALGQAGHVGHGEGLYSGHMGEVTGGDGVGTTTVGQEGHVRQRVGVAC